MYIIKNTFIGNQYQHVTWWAILAVLYVKIHPSQLEKNSSLSIKSATTTTTDGVNLTFPQFSENIYKFKHKIYNVSIPENSVGKTYATAAPHEDRLGISINHNVDVKYRITSGDRDKLFKVEERTVGDFAFLSIRTRTSNVVLNREKSDEYSLVIKAIVTIPQDTKNYTYETETVVNVRVLDRNDLSPLFYPTEYEKTVPEDMEMHKSILTVTAEDADLGINGEIYYSFFNDNEYFAIHPTSGVITLTRPLRFAENARYELTVFASDRTAAISHRSFQGSKARVVIKVAQVCTC